MLKDSHGQVLLDSDVSALYVLNYSEPFSGRVSKQELEEHLYSDATRPDLVPYVMSYYKPRWGFCLSHKQRQELLKDDFYEVDIKTRKVQGAIKVGRVRVIALCSSLPISAIQICSTMSFRGR